jgi:hypothetical protein
MTRCPKCGSVTPTLTRVVICGCGQTFRQIPPAVRVPQCDVGPDIPGGGAA